VTVRRNAEKRALCPFHGENRGSIPLGRANDFTHVLFCCPFRRPPANRTDFCKRKRPGLVRRAERRQDDAENRRQSEECWAMRQTSDHHEALGFIIIAALGVMLIVALHLV